MTLKDHNKERHDQYKVLMAFYQYPKPNGIECPECGYELNDLDNATLTSNPPKKNVGCPACKWRGFALK